MGRFSNVIALFISLFIITVIFTGVHWLENIEEWPETINFEKFSAGHAYLLFSAKAIWAQYPSMPSFENIFYIPVLISSGAFLFVVWYFLSRKFSIIGIGLACVAVGAFHYLAGMLALSNSPVLESSSRWIAVMLLGVLYSCAGCAIFAAWDILSKINFAKIIRPATVSLQEIQQELKERDIVPDAVIETVAVLSEQYELKSEVAA